MCRIVTALVLLSVASPLYAGEPGALPRENFADAEKAFREAKALLQREYVDESVTEDDLYRGAVAGMLAASGRKWDSLLSPSSLSMMHEELAGMFVGIGIEIDTERSYITVIAPIPGSPADKAGILAGDRIIKIDGRAVKEKGDDTAMYSIRGKANTPITLTILRETQVITKTVIRAAIGIVSVSDLSLPSGVTVVWVRTFNEKTPGLLRAALQRVAAKSPKGLVIDLRQNQGGLFDKMVESAALLLPKGASVVTEVRRGNREVPVRTEGEPVLRGVPVAVLVNGDTASGAEIFAGALRDTIGARLVGSKTLGKWNVQKVADLPNGYAIKYTVGTFKTPKGLAPDGKGLEPEVPVDLDEKLIDRVQRTLEPTARLAADAQLRAALALLK